MGLLADVVALGEELRGAQVIVGERAEVEHDRENDEHDERADDAGGEAGAIGARRLLHSPCSLEAVRLEHARCSTSTDYPTPGPACAA